MTTGYARLTAAHVTTQHVGQCITADALVRDDERYPLPVSIVGILASVQQWRIGGRTWLHVIDEDGMHKVDVRATDVVSVGTLPDGAIGAMPDGAL